MKFKMILEGVALSALLAGCNENADVIVSQDGEVRTIAEAVLRVKEMRAAGKIPAGKTAEVWVAPGTHFLNETLDISGEGFAPIHVVGAGAEKTIISGGHKLGPFTAGQDGIWRCKVPAGLIFEQLWVNGKRAQIAKEPDKFYFYVHTPHDEEIDPLTGKVKNMCRRAFDTDAASLAALAKLPQDELEDATIQVWWAWDSEFRKPLKVDAQKGALTLRTDVKRDFFMWKKWMPRFTIENCRTALTAPGEWFLDKKASELLYIPRAGEKVESTSAIAPALDLILAVHDIKGVSFEGLAFSHNGWCVPKEGFYCRQSGNLANAAIIISNACDVAFKNCEISHTANYGIWFSEGTHNSSITHSFLEDLGAGGVRMGARTWSQKDPEGRLVSHITADDNIIANGGHVFSAGTGVYITFARDCTVTHNEICDLYYSGICCGWVWGYAPAPNRNNNLSWNHIHHLGKGVLSDMGFIYTLGDSRGTIVAGNHGHDMFSYGYTGSGGTGLYPDEGSYGILWTSNLIHHTKTSALSQHYGKENFFKNNIFAFNTKPESSVAGRWRIENHTSLMCSNNVFVWSAGHGAWHGPGGKPSPVHDLVFGSNLWWSPDPIASNAFNRGTWEMWRKSGMDEGSIVADPLFVDWKNNDWHLKPESPAFKIGFKEWDYTQAGVRKSDMAWRQKAASVTPAKYDVAPEPPLNPGKKKFQTSFESSRPGTLPGGFEGRSSRQKHGYVMASTRAHHTGKQSLELHDYKGLAALHSPYAYQTFRITSETFVLKYALKCAKDSDFACEWREWSPQAANGQYDIGPYVRMRNGKFVVSAGCIRKDGKWTSKDIVMPGYAPDVWLNLEFTVHTPKEGLPTWDFALIDDKGVRHEEKGLYFRNKGCKSPDWIALFSFADTETMLFIDDYSYENK